MANRTTIREFAKRLLRKVPIYAVLPSGDLRTYAAVHYLSTTSDEQICEHLERTGRMPSRHLSAALISARAALATERPALADEIASRAIEHFPEAVEMHAIATRARGLLGDHDGALRAAEKAAELEPGSPELAAALLRWWFWAGEREAAESFAVQAVTRFSRSTRVLWEAAAQCRREEQFARIHAAWLDAVDDPADVPAAVRPLASAAAHSGLLEVAVELYAANILRHLGAGSARGGGKPSIHDKDPWTAIRDVDEALRGAGIPYFFANGTALGFIREGGPLSHDTDIDVGIHDASWETERVIRAFREHDGFVPFVRHPDDEKLLVHHRTGTPVDVFRYFERDGLLWHAQGFVRWHNTPFEVEVRRIRDLEAPLPADADQYLTECYGEWRTPDPGFDAFVDAPNVEISWSGYDLFPRLRRMHDRFLADRNADWLAAEAREVAGLLERTGAGRGLLRAVTSQR